MDTPKTESVTHASTAIAATAASAGTVASDPPPGGLWRPALVLFVAISAVTGLAYPLAVTGAARLLAGEAAGGSLVRQDGRVVGSALIGQSFTAPKYFWGRPSATADAPYNGLASGGSNLGPLNPALVQAVRERIEALRAADPRNDQPVPVDLVTASASGLDPHISPAAARFQAGRVARARGWPEAEVIALIERNTETPLMGVIGEARVNLLALNLALDAARH